MLNQYTGLDAFAGSGASISPPSTGPTGPCSLADSYTVTSAFPSNRGTSAHPLHEQDIQDVIRGVINTNSLSVGSGNDEFFVFTPYRVYDCATYSVGNIPLPVLHYGSCSSGAAPLLVAGFEVRDPGSSGYCAYHRSFVTISRVQYAVMPDVGTNLGGCPAGRSPNHDPFADGVIDKIGHEQFESVSNPYNNGGWWESITPSEIGENGGCNDNGSGSFDLTNNGYREPAGDTVALNRDHYKVQLVWDNSYGDSGGCTYGPSGQIGVPIPLTVNLSPASTSTPIPPQAFKVRFVEEGQSFSMVPTVNTGGTFSVTVWVVPGTDLRIVLPQLIGTTSGGTWCW